MSRERVLVTGAGGFIGGHVAQLLAADDRYDVVATSRSSGAQFARLGVPIRVGNLGDPAFVTELTEGIESVVHCAYGADIDASDAFSRLVTSAADAGATKFVHLSTVEVYANHEGTVAEDAPLTDATEGYGALKARIERRMRDHAGLFATTAILRPAIVYGPFCRPWTIRPLLRLAGGWKPDLPAGSTCNPVHVTDVARIIHRILEAPPTGTVTYNVVGPDLVPWTTFYETMAAALPRAAPSRPSRRTSSWLGAAKRLGMRVGRSLPRPVQRTVLRTAKTVPRADLVAENLLRSHKLAPTDVEREVYRRNVVYSNEALRSAGLEPVIPFKQGMQHTLGWADDMGLLGKPVTAASLRQREPGAWTP